MDDFNDIQTEQAFCNGKAVMREKVLELLREQEKVLKGSDRALVKCLIKKIGRLEVE